ncbi:hypothetical protein L6164_002497 [Bauhinia variegata]|uniref:Uncharacterized protein n=1 Tax=Bauhinia variegata TaxID=167791 RepID=A0ACB9PYE9_BAUVA|nr:hypothetical protein L6164_002497 [Bauhinia variegata]
MEGGSYLDTILVPLSLFLTVAYHVYLCHTIKNRPSRTTFGTNKVKRKAWCSSLNQGDDKKAMLVVQSVRNALMVAILVATITILVSLALAALSNNSYNSDHLFSSGFFGSKSDKIYVLKYGSASFFLLMSFLCSSMAVGFLIDANLLMNSYGELLTLEYMQTIIERGLTVALIGTRLLCVTFPLLMWMLGPVPVLFSSLALIWVLHGFDFVCK